MDDGDDYYLSERDEAIVTAIVKMLTLARLAKRPGTRKAALYDVGLQLQRLREAEGRDKREWLEIVKRECRLGKNRAYEIVAFTRNPSAAKSGAWLEKWGKNSAWRGEVAGKNYCEIKDG